MAPSRGIFRRINLASALVATLVLLVQLLDVTTVAASFQLQKPSKIYDAAYHAPNRKDRVRTDKLPSRVDAGHFSSGALFGNGRSDVKLSHSFKFLPFFGPSSGKTPVEIEVTGVFPSGVDSAYCHFGSKTTAVKVARAKRHSSKLQTIKFTCYSPVGKPGKSIAVSVSVNDVTYYDAAQASSRFYYYSEPRILDISPAISDLQGGTLVTVYPSHDIFSQAFGSKRDEFFKDKALGKASLSNIQCTFDGIRSVGLRKRKCYERSCFVCISPAVQDVGKVEVTVAPNGINRLQDRTHFTYTDLNYAPGTVVVGTNRISSVQYGELQSKLLYGEDPGVFYELTYPGSKYVPQEFYDTNMYEFYQTSLERHEAQFCLSKITTNLGPVSGGTVVTLGGRGSISKGKEDFYCVFGNTFVQASSVTYSFSDEMYLLECTTPSDTVGGVAARVSLDGVEAASSGLTFTYHNELDVSSITPSSVPSVGGTSVEITLKNDMSGISSRSCVCRFQVSLTQVLETTASYDEATKKVTCTAPGVTTDLDETAVEVSVSFNGKDFGPPSNLFTTGKTAAGYKDRFDFYGLLDGLIPIAALELVQTVTPSLSISESASYGEDMCVHFTMNSIAVLSGLELFGITQMPDLQEEVLSASFEPSFEMDLYEYSAVVNYEVHSIACRGVGADTYSNIFVENSIVPSLGVSDSIPLVTGMNKIEIAIFSSNGLYSNTYTLQIERLPQRTTKSLSMITVNDAEGSTYTLNPSFQSGVLSYSLAEAVPYHLSSVAVTITHGDTYGIVKASVAADKSDEVTIGDSAALHTADMNLQVGSNTMSLESFAQDRGISQTYSITASRLSASTDSTFSKVELKNGGGEVYSLTPAFSQETTTYDASIRYTDTFTISLTTANQKATFKGPDGVVHTHTGTYSASIPVGVTVLTFELTAQDLTTTRTYTINLTREVASADARLGSIETKACSSITQANVEPAFSSDIDTYTAPVYFECSPSLESDPMGAQYISVNATCLDKKCSGIRIYEPKGDRWITATPGQYTTLELNGNPLSDITNAILLEVTAEDDIISVSTKKTYTLNAVRQKKDNNANLLSLVVNNAATSGFPTSGVLHRNTGEDVLPAFDKTHHEYWMEVENSVASLTVTASVASGFAILKVGILSPASLSTVSNGTESQALSLTAGQTTTITVEVLSQRYQPNESVEGYDASTSTAGTDGTGSRIINYIHVFRRTKSTDATLSGLVVSTVGPADGVVTAFNPTFASATTAYSMTVRYYIGTLNITGTCPDTASPVSYKNHTSRCSVKVDTVSASSGGVLQKTLVAGTNAVNVVVTAEDETTTKTYTITVTKQVPQTDSSLKSLGLTCGSLPSKMPPAYQTDLDSSITASCWLSKTATGGDPSVAGYDSAFAASHLVYYVRAQHSYLYHGAVVSPDLTFISFTPKVNSTVDSVPVATMTLNGVTISDSVASASQVLLEAPSSQFPTPKTTTFSLEVTAEDGSKTTYTIHVVKAAVEPAASEWVKYYELNTYSNKTSTSIVAGTDTIFSLDINKSKWNSDIGSTLSSLTDVFTPISAMVFEPIVKLNTTIDVAASNASLSVGGRCSTGYSCINYYCSANGTASSTVCDKSVPYTLVPELVGDYEFKVQAYSQFVNLVGSQSVASTFHVIHAKMSLNKTKIVYPTDGLVGYVSQPGPENVLLQAYDIYGNIILDTRLTYTSDQIEVLLCPPDFIPQNSSYDPTAPAPPGYEGYCRCGPATGCSVPQRATISQNNNGTYTLQMSTLTTGINNIYMSADYSGLPLNGGPGSDYFGTYPVPISVSTNPIGIRSTLVFNSSAESFVGNSTQNPYFHVSAYDQYSNKISTGGDMSTISLSFDPPLTYGFVLTDEGLGMYKVVVSTEVAAKYKVNLYINNAISVGSPFTFQVFAGNFSDKSFADFPAQSYAGVKKQFYVHPRDSFGNAIEYNSPHGSVADRLTLEVTSLTTSSKEITEQTFTLQPDGTYLCNFTAPTNATQSYGQKVFFLDKSKSQNLFEVVAKVSSVLDILGSYPNPAKSTYFAADNQKAGNVILGIVGIDDYGNRSPHFWSKWSASLTLQNGVAASYIGPGSAGGPITAKATADLYQTTGGSVQIAFSTAVNISGDYLVQYYYDDTLVTGLGSDYSISVEPADIGMFSNISSIPSTTALGQLVTVDVDSYDTFGNKISTGNQTDLVNIKIYKQVDQTDVVDYEIADNGDGTFQVKFSPKRSGVYVFEVIYNSDGKSASQTFDVKFEFALPEHFEAILPQTFAAGVESTIVIQPIEGVDLGAAAKSVIIAQLRSTDTSLSPVNLTVSTPDSDGRRTLSVLKTISGNYFLDIFLEGKHAGSSPYSIPILPGPISTTNVDDLNQTTFYSDDVIEVTLQLFDQYNNSAQVDIENDISVKYYQKPEGLIVEADVTQTASGYTASVKLTLAAEYQIQIIVKGTQLCIEGRQDCTPTVTVLPGNVNALTSLLEGNGLGKTIVAGIEGNVRVVPLDSYSNLAQESKSQLMEYTLNIFAAGNSTQVGSPIKLTFSALDVSHSASYTLNEAGKYQMQVVQQDNAIVTGKLIDVEVVPSDAVVANTQIDPIVSNVAVGSFGRINFSLKDQFQNVIMTDLGKDVGLMLTNPSKVLSSEANDVSLVFLDGTYNATFSTTVAGTYSVSVQVFGVGITSNDTIRFVPGMPFASTSIARLAGNGLGTAGQKNVLYIDGKDKYGNARTELGGSYTVDVSVPHGTSTKKLPSSDISMTWNTEGAVPFYQVEFVCEPKGVAFVEVKIDGEQVVGSPLSINVSPSTIDPQRCILSGPGTTGGILNQETFFEIQSMDSYGNERTVGGDKFEVSVKCTTSPCPAVDVDVKDQNTGKYDVRYTLKSLGTFTLEVRLGLEDVGLLPVRSPLVVSSKNTAGLINLFVSQVFGIPSSVSAGVKQTITVIALDSEGFQLTTGGETFVASIAPIGLSSSKLEFPSIDLQNGTYSIDFELVSAGPYQLDLHHISSIGAKTLVGSNSLSYPVSVECLPGISTVEKSKIIQPGIPTTVPAGEFHSVFVQAIDIYGNTQVFKDGVEDVWTIEGSPVNSSVALQVASTRKKVSLSEGLYELAFKLPDIGLYQLDILLQNTSGSYPLASAVVEGIPGGLDASQVYTLDTSNLETGAGNATEISFKPRDVSGNIIPSLSSIPTCSVDVSPVDENAFNYTNIQEIVPVMTCVYTKDTNTFVASFMSLKSGKFSLSVKLDSAHILGSPFEANIHPASPSYAKTEGIDFTGVEVNEKLAPLVTLFDQYNNTVLDGSAEITVQAIQAQAEGLRESYSSFVENYGNGTYKASLQVQIADTFNFVVITGGKTLLNRTLQVDPLQTSAIQSFINPNSYFDGASFTVSAGTVVESTIVAIAEDGNKQQGGKDVFSVSMSPDSVYLASVIDSTALSGTVDGEYSFRFMTKRALADGYLLSLTLGGSHVKGSPYPVRVSPGKASASQSNIYSGNYGYDSSLGEFGSVAGVGRKFLLQLRDEYGNDLDQETSSSSGNKLSVKIDGATNVTTSIAGMPDGRFEMFYSVNLANTYYLQAQLEGVNVGGGSSITVVAGENDFSQFHVYGPGITEEVIVGYTYHFNIEARDKYGNTRQDDGSTLPFLQVDMVSKVLDRKTSSTTDHKFDLVQIKYESSGSSAGSQEQWKAGSFRVMFKTTTSGQIHTTISGCSVAGSTCSHLESDLEKYNVEAQGVASSPYSTQKAKPQSMTASTLSGVGLQGGVLASGATKTEALPIVIEPRDKYGNILELGNDFASLLAVSITPSLGITSTGIVTLDDRSGFAFNLTATAIGDYYLDVKYNGTSLISNPVKIPVYTSYPPIDPAQCIDYGDIFEFCVVGQTCKSSIQLYTEAKDPTCWTDQSTGKLMVSSALRYAEKVQRPTECQGIFYPFSKDSGGESYVTVLADSTKVNDIIFGGDGTYTASMGFSISGLHTIEAKVGPDTESRWIQTVTVAVADGKTKVIKVFSSNTTDLTVSSYPTLALTGQEIKVVIQPKDKFGNKQDYVAAIEDDLEVNYTSNTFLEYSSTLAKKRSTTSSIPFFYHEASYVPTKPGTFSGQIYHGYAGSGGVTPMLLPFGLTVLAGLPSNTTSVVTGTGIHSGVVHEPGNILVELRDKYNNKVGNSSQQMELFPSFYASTSLVDVSFKFPSDSKPEGYSISTEYSSAKEAYSTEYLFSQTALVNLDITIMGNKLVLNNYIGTTINAGSISPSQTTLEGPGVGDAGPISAGNVVKFKILAKDEYGNRLLSGGSIFNVVIQSVVLASNGIDYIPDGKATTSPSNIVDNEDGTYETEYTLTLASYYHVEVRRGAVPIKGSPYLIQVLPGATDAASSIVYCEPDQLNCPLETLSVGKQGKFYIQAKDKYGGNKADFADQFFYSVVGGGFSKSSFAQFRDILYPGQYAGSFFTNTAGKVDITVRLMGNLVYQGSTIVVPGPANAFNSEIVSPLFPSSTVSSSSQSVAPKVFIVSKDAFGNKLTSGGLGDQLTLEFKVKNGDIIIPVDLTDEGDGTYSGLMTIKKADQYVAVAKLNGESLEKKDLHLLPAEIVPSNTLIYGQQEASAFTAGANCTILVQTFDEWFNVRYEGSDLSADKASIQISVASADTMVTYTGNSIKTEFSVSNGQYRITFVSELSGVARLKLTIGGTDVLDQTTQREWQQQVQSGDANPSKSTAYGAGTEKALSGTTSNFNVKVVDAFGNAATSQYLNEMNVEFALVGNGPTVAAVAAISKEIKWLGNSVYQVVYTPPSHSANYGLQVRVFLDEKVVVDGTNEIHKSFITVYSEAGEVSYPKTSITKESGEELVSFSSSSTSAGVPFSVYFQLADSNGVSVITSPSQDWLTVSVIPSVKSTAVVEVSPGFFRADILAEEIGDYKVSFFGDGTALGANDGISEPLYYLKVLPGWPSSALQSKHSFYQANLIAGIPFSFAITAYDLYGNAQGNQSVIYGSEKFGAAMYPLNGSISTDASCKATDNYDGTYGITCQTTIATTYRLSIYLDTATGERKEIGGTDSINVSVQPGQFSSSNSVVLAESLSIAAGNQFSAIIQGRDSFNNLHTSGGVIFDVSITEADSSPASMYDKKLVDRGDGKYQLTFALYQKGKYLLSILEEVTKLKVAETLSLDVTAASIDIGNSVISGSGLNGAIAGQTATINVLLKDKYGNVADGQNEVQNMKFEIVGATSSDFADVSSVDESDNILLSYKIQFPADGLLSLSHNGLDVPSVGSVKIIPQKSPEIVSATFFDRYRKMSMVFDVSTDRGVSKVELDSNCGLYLKSESIALLGERPSCIWKDDKEITITLGYGATISPGDKLVVRDSIIMNSAQNSLYVSGFVAVKASSENPPTPSLSIVSSKSVGLCDDITLDVSSSSDQSGRPLTFTYTCESLHEDAYQVVEALKSLQNTNQTRVTLQSSLFVPGLDYKFGVVAKNFLGIAASSSVTVSKQAIPVPNIYVLGGSTKTIPKSHAITIEAYASFPDGSCLTGKSGESFGSMLENMEFIWSQTEGQAMTSAQSEAERNAHTSSLATRYFYLPSNILEAGSYKFQIRGNVKGSSQFASTAEVTLNVEASAINFNFVGGSRSVTVNQPLDISVDAVDPDDATGGATSAIPFEYSWDCKTATNTACPFTSTPVEYYQSSSKLPLSPKVGAFLPAGEYRFTATVSKEPLAANRIVTKSIDITVINTTVAAPVLSISGPKTAGKFNPSQQLTLEAVVEPSTYMESLTWSCSVGSLDLSKAALTTTTGSKYLVLKEDSLIGGQDYQFVATIPFGDLQLKAKFDMSVNAPPSSGLLRVTPSSGVEGLTVFEAAALNWVDNAEDQPLEYLFYSKDVSDSSAPEKLLSLAQDSGTLSFILPVGTYKIIAIISDSHGASTRIESESNIVVSKLSAGRRRLLQASSNSTMASDYIQNTILGFWNVGQISLTQMAIDIYLQNFITATNDKVPLSCNAVSSMSEPHGEILDLLLQIRNLKPFSAPLFEQQMCAYAGVSSDVEAVSANNVVKLYNQIANLQDSAVASNDFISSTSFLCMAEAISNAALVLEAQCENQPAQLRAEVFRLLDKMQQLTGKQLGPDATPMSLSTTSFTTTVKKFVLSDGQNSLGLNLGDFSDLQAEYSNFTAKFDSAGVTSSFATMALTQIRTPNWITNVKDRHRLVSDLHMIQFDFDFENVNDETLLGIRVEKNTNVQLHLQDKFPTTQLWQGNQWLPSLTNTSVSHTNSLDVLGNHSISGSSIFPSTYILHYKLLVFGAYMVDTPKPPPPPPPPPNPPPPNPPPPPPPPPIVKEDKEELDLLYIVLIAVGGFLVLCFFIGCCCCRKNSRKKRIISAADDDTDIEDEEIPEVERNSEYSQLQAVAGEREQYKSSHFNPFASNQVNLPSHHSTQQHKTLRDMLLANRN